MKKFLLAAATLLFGLGASAQESKNGTYIQEGGKWYYMIEDFEEATENQYSYSEKGTATVNNVHPIGEGSTKSLYIHTTDWTYFGYVTFHVNLSNCTLSDTRFVNVIYDIYFDPSGNNNYKNGNEGIKVWVTNTEDSNRLLQENTGDAQGARTITAPLSGHYLGTQEFDLLIGGIRSNNGRYYIDNVRLECAPGYTPEQPSSDPDVYPTGNLLSQDQWGFENGIDDKWYVSDWNKIGDTDKSVISAEIANDGYESSKSLMVKVVEGGDLWRAQTMFNFTTPLTKGAVYTVSFRAKADMDATMALDMQQKDPDWLKDGVNLNSTSLTNKWALYTGDVTITHDNINRFTLNVGDVATNYYIDNVSVVLKKAPVHATGVSLDRENAEVSVGGNISLVATVAPADASFTDVTWTSNNEEVATVENGVVTGHKVGTATITATTVDGGHTASCVVTVKEVVLENWAKVKNDVEIEYAYDENSKTLYFRPTGNPIGFPEGPTSGAYAYHNTYSNVDNLTIVFLEGITSISEKLFFWDYKKVKEFKFPQSLINISKNAFDNCKGIKAVDLSHTSVETIGDEAFVWATQVESVKLPATLQNIGKDAFLLGHDAAFEFHSIPTDFGLYTQNGGSRTHTIILDDAEHPFIATSTTNMPTIASAEYKRNVTAAYSTICLPFNAAIPGGVTVYEMSDASTESITLTAAQSIKAGKPYVVATANLDITEAAPTISVETTPAGDSSMQFIGVMQKKELVYPEAHAYGLFEGKLYLNEGTMTVNPMRAYFESTATETPAREMSLLFGGEVTSINNVAAASSDIVEVYNVNGARQPGLAKGINLVKTANGNIVKVIVK